MQKGKVVIFNGSLKTRAKVNHFLSELKLKNPEKKITQGEAVEFAIEQAEKVPELEKHIEELRAKAWEEHLDKERISEDYQRLKLRVVGLESRIIELEGGEEQ